MSARSTWRPNLSAPIVALENEIRERWSHRHSRFLLVADGMRGLVKGLRLLRAAEDYACRAGFHNWRDRSGLEWCSLCGKLRDPLVRMDGEDMHPIEDGNEPAEVGS